MTETTGTSKASLSLASLVLTTKSTQLKRCRPMASAAR